MNPIRFIFKMIIIRSLESIKTEKIDSGTDLIGSSIAISYSSDLAINEEAMGTTEPVTAKDSIANES